MFIFSHQHIKDYVNGASNFEMKIALECNARPRMLERCEAESSEDWVLDLDNPSPGVTASVRVESRVDTEGAITITMMGSVKKTLNVIWVAGLNLSQTSTFSLPGGVTASKCDDTSDTCWTQQQGVVILRNANITLESGEIIITWSVL